MVDDAITIEKEEDSSKVAAALKHPDFDPLGVVFDL
jgi:hypothetical protein